VVLLLYLWMKQSGDVNSIFDSVNSTSTISCGSPLHMMALLKLYVCIGKKGPLKIWTENAPPSHGNYMDFTDVKRRSLVFTALINQDRLHRSLLSRFFRYLHCLACNHHPPGNPMGDYMWWPAKIAFHGVFGKIPHETMGSVFVG